MSKSEINPTERTPGELEEYMLEESGYPPFETACRKVATDAPTEERMTVVVSRRKFHTATEDEVREIPPKSYLVGEVDFTDNVQKPWLLTDSWSNGIAPSIGDPSDPVPAVGGEFFGRDNSVFIVPYMTITGSDIDSVGLVSEMNGVL